MKSPSLFDMNTTILTPNRRLAATLLKKYNQGQQEQSQLSWHSLDILPFPRWLERLWQTASWMGSHAPLQLLTSQQERTLWEDIINKMPENGTLLQATGTADIAKSAWSSLKQWQVSLHDPALGLTEDGQTFLKWADAFQKISAKNDWLDSASLQPVLCQLIRAGNLPLPKSLFVIGFTELTPIQQAIFEACERQGTSVFCIEHFTEQQPTIKPCQRIGLTDSETEIVKMACWAKALWQQSTDLPLRIGCIVPQLDKIRDQVLQVFLEVFTENNQLHSDYSRLPFNISAGKSLTLYSLIDTAFLLLQLPSQSITYPTLSRILRSPFIGDAEGERIKRAELDHLLQRNNIARISLSELIAHPKLNMHTRCPHLTERLLRFQMHCSTKPPSAPCSDWAHFFLEGLTRLGWPGERSLNSQEYQIVQRFLDLLYELRGLDPLLGSQSYSSALHYLMQWAVKTIYQPETPDTPIQILGLLEAAPLPFDYSWVIGLNDSVWPASCKPNPLIPQRLQKELNMPHASADRELQYSKRLTEQLKLNSNHIIFSYPKKNTEIELRPSSLIHDLPEITLELLPQAVFQPIAETIYQSQQLEHIQDNQAPPLTLDEKSVGGTSIFKLQAACPFKAFAELRLHARKVEPPALGLRNQDRGILLHKALELIWHEIKTSEQLHHYSDNELKQLIDYTVQQTMEIQSQAKTTLTRLESIRLKSLLWKWLQYEKNRPPFKVVSYEAQTNMTIGPISITLRVDRVDELPDGSQLIIDYKAGKNKNTISDWFGERLNEPQLPLYCVSSSDKTMGFAFAEVRPDGMSLRGISQLGVDIETIQPFERVKQAECRSWNEQLTQWRSALEKVGTDFFHGIADVSPKNQQTCRHCHLKPLCRIYSYE